MTQKSTLNKYQRLKSKKLIDELFKDGETIYTPPFRLLYKIHPAEKILQSDSPLLFSVTVPKKRFKSAPTRNLIKRRTRESYRLNKMPLQLALANRNVTVVLMFIYIGNKIPEYAHIDKAMKRILKELKDVTTS